jgi:hypothetical protein
MSDERTILDYLEDISNAILDIRSFGEDRIFFLWRNDNEG